jgi:predicted MFS family arabinose efflux permease
LAGVANSVLWTIAMSLTLDFAPENERPAYIGLANTPIAPAAILFPLVGGWLSDTFGFGATFLVAAAFGLITAAVLQFIVREPRRKPAPTNTQPVMATSA